MNTFTMAQASTKGPAPKGTQKGDQPTKALSDAPVQVMTLSEAWRECSQQIKLAVRSEQKARLDYLKNTEYGKEFMMRMTEVATVVVDQGSAGGKSTGNTAGMLGFQDPTPDDPSSSQVGSKQPDSIIPGMPNFEPSDATKPQRRASRRRHSVRSKQNAKSGSGIDGQDTTNTPEEERSASVAGKSGCGESADARRSNKAASTSQRRRSSAKSGQRGKSKSGKGTKGKLDEDTGAAAAAMALGGNFGIF